MRMLLALAALTSARPAVGIQLPAFEDLSLSVLQGSDSEGCNSVGKDLDLIIYGATGFTGKLAAQYLSEGLPGAPRWAIGGRSSAELEALNSELAAGGSGATGPSSVIVADLQDLQALQAMTQRAKVVLTYAGPYEKYGGENLIKASLATCTHYVDITGETAWKAEMLQRYAGEAKSRGLAVVQSAGLDSLPADLISALVAEEVAADGQGPPTEVAVLWSKVNGAMSGGTLASGVYQTLNHLPVGPYGLAPGATRVLPVAAEALFKEEKSPYPMSSVDLPVMHRSMLLRFPGSAISVSEASGPSVAENQAAFAADPRMLTDPPPAMPAPGEGPPAWMLEAGSFATEARARRAADGHTAAVKLEGAGDPGYQACAQFSVEFALGLARLGTAAPGFPTPSVALGAAKLREILEAADGGHLMNFTAA